MVLRLRESAKDFLINLIRKAAEIPEMAVEMPEVSVEMSEITVEMPEVS